MKPFPISGLQLKITSFCICTALFACQKNISTTDTGNSSTSSVNIYLTDDQSLVFDNVFLDIQKIEIKVEDSSEQKHESEHQNQVDDSDNRGEHSSAWMALNINPGIYDILKFRNGLDTLFATATFPAVKGLQKVRLTLGNNNRVIYNGTASPLKVKGHDNFVVIKISESLIQLNSGGITNFWIDVDAGRSIKKHGDEFELKPSVKIFSKDKSGEIEGRVLPKEAGAIVMAINGSDTASAKPEREGEFKFIGLKPGTYSLLYHATTNNYKDTIVNNIRVIGKEDIKVSTVTLLK